MRIALDATYSIDPHPSGIAVYSRQIMNGLAAAHREDEFLHCYRVKQFFAAHAEPRPKNVHRRLLIPPVPNIRADLFHGLNQRIDRRPARCVVTTFHDLFVMTGEYSTPEFRARFTQQARRAAQNSDLIIAVSEFTAHQVTGLLNVPSARVRVVHHGIIPPESPPMPREKIVLFVGALQLRKNVARLIAAFEKLPNDWRLILAGAATGFAVGEILARIQSSVARERITITGYVAAEKLDSLYACASIFAFPSLDEGFGLPVLEAMARGIPVVTSNRSALPEIAQDAALLVDPYDIEELAAALQQLASDPSLRDSLVEAGRQRAAQFTGGKAVEKTYALYRELVG